jgi:hypothetical protein
MLNRIKQITVCQSNKIIRIEKKELIILSKTKFIRINIKEKYKTFHINLILIFSLKFSIKVIFIQLGAIFSIQKSNLEIIIKTLFSININPLIIHLKIIYFLIITLKNHKNRFRIQTSI